MLPPIPAMLAHYRLVERIDSGGMGVVYLARNTHLDCDVAIKILPSRLIEDSQARRKLHHEAHLLSKLHNPHVAIVHDCGRQDDVDFIVLEYVPGTTLEERIGGRPLPESLGLDFGTQLADGLAAVHAAGLVHCDVTPRNIRITPEGHLKLLDFGLARHLRTVVDGTTSSTDGSGGAFGTPPYMAPEMLHEGRFDARVDIYAAGTVLYEMATARRPFDAEVPGRLVQAILHEAPLAPRALNSRISAGFEAVILKTLDKNPDRRYQTARELQVDLERIRSATTATVVPRPAPRWRRRRVLAAAAATTLSAAVLAAARLRPDDGGPVRSTDLVPIATWPGEKSGSRLSPDGQWASFVARHGDRYGLWLRKISMAEPRLAYEPAGVIVSHVWSPDGERIALLLDDPDNVYLRCIPSQGGSALWSVELEKRFAVASLVRWIDPMVYAEIARKGLWAVDILRGSVDSVLAAQTDAGLRIDFDVAADTRRVLFTNLHQGHRSLWTCNLDGGGLRRVRDGVDGDDGGRWMGGGGNRVVFSTSLGGSSDLWSTVVGGREIVRLTFGIGSERLDDVAANCSGLTFNDQRYAASLWQMEADGTRPRQLTSENAVDLWPSASDAGDVVVFQRGEPEDPSSFLYAARMLRLQPGPARSWMVAPLAARGGEALVSPEGRFVAFVRRQASAPGELWIEDLKTEHAWRAATDVALPGLHMFPVDRTQRMTAWSRSGPTLYWAVKHSDRWGVHRWRAGTDTAGEAFINDVDAGSIADLRVSPDDRWVAYVRAGRSVPTRYELRFHDVHGRPEPPVPTVPCMDPERLSLLGWLDARTMLTARARTNPDYTERVELWTVNLQGAVTQLAVLDRAFVGTICLDPTKRVLLVTRSGDDGVHNIHSFDLRTRRLTRLTENDLLGVSFSGAVRFADGSILFAKHEKTESIWFVRIEGCREPERGRSWLRIQSPIS